MFGIRLLVGLGLAVAVGLGAPAPAGAWAGWVRPVAGAVAGGFSYSRAHPFAAGRRRGVDLAAAPGGAVRAPCAGRVTFAGRVPGAGPGVTVRCGALVATLLRLGAVAVWRGEAVLAGQRVGVAGARRRVRLGARRVGDRFGYLDPVALLRGAGRGPAPLAPAVRAGPSRRPGPRAPAPAPRLVARPARAGVPVRAPLAAWVGVALTAGALTAGGAERARRRRVACATPCRSTSPRRSTT